jgi:hypothetical protein
MNSHDLAKQLLAGPNLKVVFRDYIGPIIVNTWCIITISEDDADNSGDCEDLVGQKVIGLC